MARLRAEQFLNFDGWEYEIVSKYRNGHQICYCEKNIYPWVIMHPTGELTRFKTEAELWQYAIANKLFKKRKERK